MERVNPFGFSAIRDLGQRDGICGENRPDRKSTEICQADFLIWLILQQDRQEIIPITVDPDYATVKSTLCGY